MKLHKQMYYFDVAEVVPTEADADQFGLVLAYSTLDECWLEVHYTNLQIGFCSHWMQKPKAPSNEDQDF